MPNIFSQKSSTTWAEGKECLRHGLVNAAANRIYYAVFQAVKGFAIQSGKWTIDTSDGVHGEALKIVGGQGGKAMFWRRRLNELLSLRLIADYKLENVNQKELEGLLDDADNIRKHYVRVSGGQV